MDTQDAAYTLGGVTTPGCIENSPIYITWVMNNIHGSGGAPPPPARKKIVYLLYSCVFIIR
jgi:hypothetical protein